MESLPLYLIVFALGVMVGRAVSRWHHRRQQLKAVHQGIAGATVGFEEAFCKKTDDNAKRLHRVR